MSETSKNPQPVGELLQLARADRLQDLKSPSERLKRITSQRESQLALPLGIGFMASPDGRNKLAFFPMGGLGNSPVVVPTVLSYEDAKAVLKDVLPLPETRDVLFRLASSDAAGRMPLLLGGTGLGKTFGIKLFHSLTRGPDAHLKIYYCHGQSETGDLFGKMRPAGLTRDQVERIEAFLASDAGAALRAQGGSATDDDAFSRAAAALNITVQKGSFVWEHGHVVKAMLNGEMLVIEELTMAPPAFQNAFLQFRGKDGKLASDMQLPELDGRTITAKPGFSMVFSANPPGTVYRDRHAICASLRRALDENMLDEYLHEDSIRAATREMFKPERLCGPSDDGTVVDLRNHPELGQEIAEVVSAFFLQFREKVMVSEVGNRQRIIPGLDHLAKISLLVQREQELTADGSSVDFVATIRRAVQLALVSALQDKPSLIGSRRIDQADKENKSLGKALLDGFDHLVGDSIELTEFRGRKLGRRQILEALTKEAFESFLAPELNEQTRAAEKAAQNRATNRKIADFLKKIDHLMQGEVPTFAEEIIGKLDSTEARDEVRRFMLEQQDPGQQS